MVGPLFKNKQVNDSTPAGSDSRLLLLYNNEGTPGGARTTRRNLRETQNHKPMRPALFSGG